MIQAVRLMYYPSEAVYLRVCQSLGLSMEDRNNPDNTVRFPSGGIRRIQPFNIMYRAHNHIWFLQVTMDFPSFACSYGDFPRALDAAYARILGSELAAQLPPYEHACCDYIEYSGILPVDNADAAIERLRGGKFQPEQLDRNRWTDFHKPHATIAFCLDKKNDAHLETLARCHGTALKRRVKNPALHKTVGLVPTAAINAQTEEDILQWLYKTHHVTG